MRDTYEAQLSENRDEFCRVYDAKLKSLQEKLDRERSSGAGSQQEMYELETKVTGLTSRNAELESLNTGLNKRLAELIQDMEAESKRHRSELARKVRLEMIMLKKTLN